jgi:rhamnosyltransferase subunit B
MARILLTTIGSLGDLHPKIGIALELRQCGHDVVFATHREYQTKLAALGFEFHRLRPDNTALSDPAEMARMMDLKTGSEYIIRQWLGANLRHTYDDLLAAAQGVDAILTGEGVIPARIVAEQLQIPWALAVLSPISFFSVSDPSVIPVFPKLSQLRGLGSLFTRGIIQLSKTLSKSWAEPIHQLRQELGLPQLTGNPFIDDKYSPDLVLAMFSSALAQPQPDWPTSAVLTGFCFYDGSPTAGEIAPELSQFLATGAPPIVFTLGSAAVVAPGPFYSESVAAAVQLKQRAILLMGNNPPPGSLPGSILAVNYAPYSQVFPRAGAIVHQGGIGTTAQALRAGRPTLVMPYSHDQPDNAARVERLGTSRTIARSRYTADRITPLLQDLLTHPHYAQQANRIGQIIQAEDGVKVACDAIVAKLLSVGCR